MQQENQELLLAEIFLKPSNEIKANRFVEKEASEGPCSGTCGSGSCRGVV